MSEEKIGALDERERIDVQRRHLLKKLAWVAPVVVTTATVGARAAIPSSVFDRFCDSHPNHQRCQ